MTILSKWTTTVNNNKIPIRVAALAQSDTAVGNFTFILFLLRHAVWALMLILQHIVSLYIQARFLLCKTTDWYL